MCAKPILLIRFSSLSPTNLLSHFESTKQLAEYLYDENRMNYRFWLFENICLPSLLHQTCKDFHLAIVTSPELPEWCQTRLNKILEPLDHSIAFEPPFERGSTMRTVSERFDFANGQKITVRLDDDDALAIDWIERISRIANGCKTLLNESDQYAIFPSDGYILNLNSMDRPIVHVHAKSPYGLGLALVTNENSNQTAYSYSHFKVPQRCPTISIPKVPSFVRTFHNTNISYLQNGFRSDRNMETLDSPVDKMLVDIEERFRIDFSKLDTMPEYCDPLIVAKMS